jgi:hypothetical protein
MEQGGLEAVQLSGQVFVKLAGGRYMAAQGGEFLLFGETV